MIEVIRFCTLIGIFTSSSSNSNRLNRRINLPDIHAPARCTRGKEKRVCHRIAHGMTGTDVLQVFSILRNNQLTREFSEVGWLPVGALENASDVVPRRLIVATLIVLPSVCMDTEKDVEKFASFSFGKYSLFLFDSSHVDVNVCQHVDICDGIGERTKQRFSQYFLVGWIRQTRCQCFRLVQKVALRESWAKFFLRVGLNRRNQVAKLSGYSENWWSDSSRTLR
jgi:hypothetical protein